MAGTRDCTRYGTEVARRFAKEFASRGIVVVSGLAEGIDAASHEGAFQAVQKQKPDKKEVDLPKGTFKKAKQEIDEELPPVNTIAVLGNGVNYYYPKCNVGLQKRIAKQGLVISEYLPNTESTRYNFPFRNRIVAGLCSAVVIVEADIKSGTMITRDWALELGIDVYAVPGPITSYASRGTNAIIKEAACSIATDVADVLQSFNIFERNKENETETSYRQISFEEKMALDLIKRDEVHFDDLVLGLNFPVKKTATLLTNMEMSGLIERLAGNYFKKK
jgi:DNA processing protein